MGTASVTMISPVCIGRRLMSLDSRSQLSTRNPFIHTTIPSAPDIFPPKKMCRPDCRWKTHPSRNRRKWVFPSPNALAINQPINLPITSPAPGLTISPPSQPSNVEAPIYHTSTPITSNFSPSSLSPSFPNVKHRPLTPCSNTPSNHNPYRPSPPPTLKYELSQKIM